LFKFPEPIDQKRRDELIEAIAKRIDQFGMLVPAIFFLEMNKPLSYIGGQAMHFFAPIVGVFFNTFEDYAYFFDDRRNVELLIQKLEGLSDREDEERRAQKEAKKREKASKTSMLDEALKMETDKKDQDSKNPSQP
jgi:hypothetical protein